MGSGRCATHHVKLVKRVIERKVSKLDKFGQVSWTIGEGTIYDCPKSGQSGRYEGIPAVISLPVGEKTTNKKRSEEDQSEESKEG